MSTESHALTVPLPIDQLHQVIAAKDEIHLIDYKNSKIKGKPFIFYLSNLSVRTRIELEKLTVEELSELLATYMEVNTLFYCEELNVLTMLVLLHFMEGRTDQIATFTLPEGFLDHFVSAHEELLSKYYIFCSSLLKYCDYIRDIAEETEHDLSGYEGIIDDPRFIGVNVVWLFDIPSFFELFFSARPPEDYKQYYFPVQFQEYMFNGKNLFYFFIGDQDKPNWLLLNKLALEMLHGDSPRPTLDTDPAPEPKGK